MAIRGETGGFILLGEPVTKNNISDYSPKMIKLCADKKVANTATLLERAKAIRKTLV